MNRWILIAAAGAVAAGGLVVAKINGMAEVGSGYMAKIACSEHFLAGRDAIDLRKGEFNDISPVFNRVRLKVDTETKSVSASVYGLGAAKAVYRDGYGCTLQQGALAPLPAPQSIADAPLAEAKAGGPQMRNDVDYAAIETAINHAFADPQTATRAILVIKDGAVIAERYAAGFSASTPFLSWSMAKSVTATMIGAAVLQGHIDVAALALAPEWTGASDPRATIKWNDLLQMQDGLEFDETYDDPNSDVSRMLFRAADTGGVAAKKMAAHEPGAHWSYSSGTSNLIQRLLRSKLAAAGVDYHRFAAEALFAPLGASSFVLEPDSSGAFIGSSFVYATARDWGKLGLLYLNDGVANGVRLLPEGWSRYVAAPAAASDGAYGAHFWLNYPGADGRAKYMPGVPDDAYLMAGHEGQYVLIIPESRLVIVRTGMTRGREPMPIVAPTFAAIYAASNR